MTALTVSEVRAILSASSVDTSRLDIREESGGVVIRGPERDRGEATGVLFAAGLSHAPYRDRDEWMRRQEDERPPARGGHRPLGRNEWL